MQEQGRDLTKFFKMHVPTLENPVPKMGAGLLGNTDGIYQEVGYRLPEFILPLKVAFVGAASTFGGLVGRQFTEKAGPKTEDRYYEKEFLFSLPGLVLGKIASDFIGGPAVLKAAILGTVANGAVSIFKAEFDPTSFFIREALLVPLSLLIVKGSPAQEAS